jgi:hypothetical protein
VAGRRRVRRNGYRREMMWKRLELKKRIHGRKGKMGSTRNEIEKE